MDSKGLSVWLALIACGLSTHAEMLDRIAVTVGKTVITESEVLTNLKVAAFLDGKEPDLSGASKRKAAERLVDKELLRREVPGVSAPAASSDVIEQLRKRYGSETEYLAAMERLGITEADVTQQLSQGMQSLDASNRRFRPEVQVSDDDVRGEYNALASQWRVQHAEEMPSFDASRNQVQEIVVSRRVSQALDRWLEMAREQTSIVYHDKVFE
jgi:hypothetical protein